MKRLVASLLLLGACSTASVAPPPGALPRQVADGEPCIGPEPLLGRTEQSVTARLGAPVSRKVTRMPNRHDPGVTDELVELRYNGAVVTLHTIPKHGASFLAHLEISDARFDLIPGLGVGMDIDVASKRLGMVTTGDELRKECPREIPPTIVVKMDERRVSRVVWLNEPD
jgi:hypothetical protein